MAPIPGWRRRLRCHRRYLVRRLLLRLPFTLRRPSVAATALQIPEILEAILLHLDMADLLVSAIRVCRTWFSVVNHSPALRRALHFDPTPVMRAVPDSVTGQKGAASLAASRPELVPNPLLVKFFSPCFFFDADAHPDHGDMAWLRRANAFFSMPWVVVPRQEVVMPSGRVESVPPYPMLHPDQPADEADRRRFTTCGASWRRMLVSQPPPPRLSCAWQYQRPLSTDHMLTEAAPSDPAGLRMGQLFDFVQYHASHHSRRSLWFRVLWNQWRPAGLSSVSREDMVQCAIHMSGFTIEVIESPTDPVAPTIDPVDPEAFDAVFRCEESQATDRGDVVVTSRQLHMTRHDPFWAGRVN